MSNSIELVKQFDHQVTGISVSETGRVFVNFPRWTEDTAVSVAELTADGEVVPYPNGAWNAWRNAKKDEVTPGDHWVCIQSIVTDGRGKLWVLDPAAPAQAALIAGGAKLVAISLDTDEVVQTILFDEDAAPQGSYLNDVRFAKDGAFAFITDSGAQGALLVVELATGKAVRVLDGDPTTQVKKGLVVEADGKPLRRPDGRGVEFSADGIALSDDGKYLYWQAIKGDTLYRIETAVLCGAGFKGEDVSAEVENFGYNGVADGLMIASGTQHMYITAPQEDGINLRDLSQGPTAPLQKVVQDARLRWPDTFSQGPDGTMYVTTSHIQDSAFFKPEAPAALPTQLWKVVLG